MASFADDESDTSSPDNDTSDPSFAVVGAETEDVADLEDAQHRPLARNGDGDIVSVHEDQNEDSEDYDRANRFEGSSSTWRFYTEEERALANSLDRQRANDLGLHLYNAHALKAQVRDANPVNNVDPAHSKQRWVRPSEHGTMLWQPAAGWNAWPLRPEDVPRSSESFGVLALDNGLASETYKKIDVWKPSGILQEEILALALRAAKERLRKAGPGRCSSTHEEAGQDRMRTRKSSHETLDDSADVDVSMAEEDDFVDQRDHSTRSTRSTADSTSENSFFVDDDAARTLMNPSIRHILSQLDGLLMGLHKSRRGQARTDSRSRSRTPRSRSISKARKPTSKSRSRQPSRSKSVKSDNEMQGSDSGDDVDRDIGSNPRSKRRRPLHPRDWSEVLGMAAFTRWDPEAVDKATRRCVSLFGEGMNFRTVPLDSIVSSKADLRTYGSGVLPTTTTTVDDSLIVNDQPAPNRYFCPVQSCARHDEPPYNRAWRLYEHVRRSHKYSDAQVERLKTKLRSSEKEAAALHMAEKKVFGSDEEDQHQAADGINVDSLLQPITVRMARGKDKHPRKRTLSQHERESDVEEDTEL